MGAASEGGFVAPGRSLLDSPLVSRSAMLRWFTPIALLLITASAIWYAGSVPRVVSSSAPLSVFSAERAMRHVRQISQRPHPSGGEDHPRVREYLIREISDLGLTPQVQEATGVSTRYPSAGRVWNVLVRVPGRASGGQSVLLVAHYDGVPMSPAAGDDASGVAVLLETLRAIRTTDTLAHDVIALFTDGEEPGLLGAAAFAREHPWAKDVAVTLNFEGRGTRGPSLMFETGPGNRDIVGVLRDVGGARASSLSTAVYRSLPNDTDLSELAMLQPPRPAMNFAFIGGVQRYHSVEDDVAHLDPRTLQHHGNQALALTRRLANDTLPRPRTGDAVFFDLPLIGVIVYPEPLAPWLALLALVLPIAALVVARRRESRLWIGAVLGLVLSLLAAVVAGAFALGAASGIQRLHASIGSGAPEWSGLYALAIAVLSIAVASAGYALARRWGGAFGVQTGAMLAWGLVGVAVALAMPGASFLFIWPLLPFGVAALAFAAGADSRLRLAGIWIATVIAILILAPTLYLMVCMALGINAAGAAILGILSAFGVALLWVHIEALAGERRWRVPVTTGFAALLLFGAGAIFVRSDAAHPAGTSLIYAVDADSGTAWLSGFGWTPSARTWLGRALHASGAQRADSVPPWVQRNADRRSAFAAPMSIPPLAPSTATVLSDSIVSGNRRVTLRIVPARGTRAVGLRLETGSVLSAYVDGRRVETERYRRRPAQWALSYAAPPDSGFTLALTFPEGVPLTLGIMSRRVGIPPLSAIQIPQRPAGIIAVHDGDASLVYSRFTIERR